MYWVNDIAPNVGGHKLDMDTCYFVGEPIDRHIVRYGAGVLIQNVTLFPGIITPVDAIKWGVTTLLRKKWHRGIYNYRQLKKRFTF